MRFLAHGPGYALFLTSGAEAVLVSAKASPRWCAWNWPAPTPPEVRALEEQAAKSYYFIGNDPARWRTECRTTGGCVTGGLPRH